MSPSFIPSRPASVKKSRLRRRTVPPIGAVAGDQNGGCEIHWLGANFFDAPPAKVLIEDVGIVEHALHIFNLAGIPRADILIEGVGTLEHVIHIDDLAGIPQADILIEGVGIGDT